MGQQQEHPVARPVLRAVTGSEPGNADEREPVTEAVAVVRITAAERAGSAARRAAGGAADVARELWLHPDRLVHSVVHGEAETMKEHWAHVQSRSWVPEELSGRPEKAVALAGILHHLLVAYPVKGIAKAGKAAFGKLDHAGDRAGPLYGLIVFVILLTVLLIHL